MLYGTTNPSLNALCGFCVFPLFIFGSTTIFDSEKSLKRESAKISESGNVTQKRKVWEDSMSSEQPILFGSRSAVGLGDHHRFVVRYKAGSDDCREFLWLKIKNIEFELLRTVYLTGPFSLYVDVIPVNYSHRELFSEEIHFHQDVKPGQSFKCQLTLNDNSRLSGTTDQYQWEINVVSQITIANHASVSYDIVVGYDYEGLRHVKPMETKVYDENILDVEVLTTQDLWNDKPNSPDKPVHLIVVNHGIFSNTGADMLYLKESIEQRNAQNSEPSNILIRGFFNNIGKSEKGIKYLGKRVGDWLIQFINDSEYEFDKISFIGHSLGGPVQAFTICYINHIDPLFFKKHKPVNFITLASPMLGILAEFPKPISFALDLGALGKTGRDLTLSPSVCAMFKNLFDPNSASARPILEKIPIQPTHEVFKSFEKRTCYANAQHDGIVPLRTSALLYLDWQGLGDIKKLKEIHNEQANHEHANQEEQQEVTDTANSDNQSTTGTIPSNHQELNDYNAFELKQPKFWNKKGKTSPTDPDISESNNDDEKSSPLPIAQVFHLQKARRSKKHKKYMRAQTVTEISNQKSKNTADIDEQVDDFTIPPAASTVLSGVVAMLSPKPEPEFIIDPGSRTSTIFHDKTYSFKDLPPPHFTKTINPLKEHTMLKNVLFKKKSYLEEKIARTWHWEMSWRKVLVALQPDAHNNIIVRRRFINAFGWEVIDHLCDEHFSN